MMIQLVLPCHKNEERIPESGPGGWRTLRRLRTDGLCMLSTWVFVSGRKTTETED
jgi:hypothetical protein